MESSDEDVSSNSSGENESLESNDDQTRSPRRTLSPRREDSMSDIENICVPLPSLYHGRIRSSNGKEERISDDEVIGVGNSLIFPDSILAKYLPKDPIDEMNEFYGEKIPEQDYLEKRKLKKLKEKEEERLEKAAKNVVRDLDMADSIVKSLSIHYIPRDPMVTRIIPNRTDVFTNKLISRLFSSTDSISKFIIESDTYIVVLLRRYNKYFLDVLRKAYRYKAFGKITKNFRRSKRQDDESEEMDDRVLNTEQVRDYLYDNFQKGDGIFNIILNVKFSSISPIKNLFNQIKDRYTYDEEEDMITIDIDVLMRQRHLFRDECFMFDTPMIAVKGKNSLEYTKLNHPITHRSYDYGKLYQEINGKKIYPENADLVEDKSTKYEKDKIRVFTDISGTWLTYISPQMNNMCLLPDYWKKVINVPYIYDYIDDTIKLIISRRNIKIPYEEGHCDVCSGVTSNGVKYNPILLSLGNWDFYHDCLCERWVAGSNFRNRNVAHGNIHYSRRYTQGLTPPQIQIELKKNKIGYLFNPINHYIETFNVPKDRNAVFVVPYLNA